VPFITGICNACAAGILEECENPEEVPGHPEWIIPCAGKFEGLAVQVVKGEPGQIGRPPLDPGKVTDPTSTGRKRAKMLAPILAGQRCGWAGLKHAGGGVTPILGCNGHLMVEKKGGEGDHYQGDRHHGPDKNTLNNSVGVNLHSVCVECHHRWHALNDEFYDEEGRPTAEFPFLPVEAYYLHDPNTAFTEEEYEVAEAWWDLPRFDRGPYPFSPPDEAKKVLPMLPQPATLDPTENPFPDSPFAEIGDSE
jgi:hypothetical protein|tara:strand:+ start:34048 stop:34800 length:753 start_codon:yes stop_codon:yes gene_type:complete